MIGILTVLAAGIRREEKRSSLTTGSPDLVASAARAAHGVYTRLPGVATREREQREAAHEQHELDDPESYSD